MSQKNRTQDFFVFTLWNLSILDLIYLKHKTNKILSGYIYYIVCEDALIPFSRV